MTYHKAKFKTNGSFDLHSEQKNSFLSILRNYFSLQTCVNSCAILHRTRLYTPVLVEFCHSSQWKIRIVLIIMVFELIIPQ
jgi:hypothetical protein